MEVAKDKPYFARIDFISEEDGKTSTIYIGKNGVMTVWHLYRYCL